jgi:hypothetical protein
MKELNSNKRIKVAIALSVSFLLLNFTEYYWDQISEIAPAIGITALLIFTILVFAKMISTGLTLFHLRKSLTLVICLPTMIYFSALGLVFINPQFLSAESYQSRVKYRGCYEGTMNTGVILFRESGEFEYRHVGFFGMTTFKNGTWMQQGDTLMIKYKREPSEFVGVKLLMTSESFIKVEGDSIPRDNGKFYRGYCKGLN